MHRIILVVTGITILAMFGGQHLVRNAARAQDSPQVVGDTFVDYAKRSLHVGDKVLFASSSGVVLLTEEQSKILAKGYPKHLATVTKIGSDYFVLTAEATGGTYSRAFGTDIWKL